MRKIESLVKLGAALLVAAVLGGCAFGRSYSYADTPIGMQGVSSGGSVAVAVQDERPYVLSGAKTDRFVGLMRGGFGNPFDVSTKSGGPLADELRDAIINALKARGISANAVAIPLRESSATARQKMMDAKARRSVLATMREWKSDSMLNTDLHYDVTLTVYDERGNALASSSIKGMDNIGSAGLSPDEGIRKASTATLGKLFDDPKVIAALK